ncbi:MAG TPA: methyl-accepting chemotaxis protein [Aquabacterium sp.]|uniref:methyl-accepting chemotaxis protein n=1 Tax=Aquabacterium sp. TaxID=1872578 RepID=UPI002E2EED92|nr:methyl-accepting chemotaxis protein [Aquabacterium sp.]HEX5373310.1 methyl-accepting chemotaxis protein [Aquabacterium sp.]
MSWFANLRLLPKLMVSFALILAMTAVMGLFSLKQLETVDSAATELGDNWLPSVAVLSEVNGLLEDTRRIELLHILAEDDAGMAKQDAALEAVLARFAKADTDYTALLSSPEEKTQWEEFKADWAANLDIQRQVMALSRDSDGEAAYAMAMGQQHEVLGRARAKIGKLVALNREGGQTSAEQAHQAYRTATWSVIGVMVATIVVGLLMAVVVSRMIAVPVQQAVDVLKGVAEGDLTQAVHHNRRDEIGDMQSALSQMIDSLASMVQQVRMGADSVATASAQIAQGNVDLSSRTEEQASSLEQTAASIEEMSGTVRTNADNAHQANQLASAASAVAARGGEVVSQVVDTMNGIQSSSKKISDIIGVIDGIAFQTNILALNAAVEAARAGEQGRGFAVVAGEVRSLAQRSAQAAREIKTLISDSVEKVNAGSDLVSTAGTTMNDVVTQVRKVTDLVGEIAHASTEQSQGIGQVNQAVSQLDQMTQQNAALVEESMAAAESLKVQAERLTQAVSVFKTRHAHEAQVKAQQVIQQVKHHSTTAVKPMAPKAKAPAPVTPVRKAAAPAVRAPLLTPQLAAPVTATSASSGTKDSDDWETF